MHTPFKISKTKFKWLIIPLLGLLLAGCGKDYESVSSKTLINDSANLLSPGTEQLINELNIPPGYFLHVETRDTVTPKCLTIASDKAFKKASQANDTLEERGLFVYVTKQPALVQLRVGEDFTFKSMWNNAGEGEEYMAIQEKAVNGKIDSATLSMISHVENRLSKTELPWFKRRYNNRFSRNAYHFINDLGNPEKSLYGNLINPVLNLRVFELNNFGTKWITFTLMAILGVIVSMIINLIFIQSHKYPDRAFIGSIINVVVLIIIMVPVAASAHILSSERMEDVISLSAQGFQGMNLNAIHDLFYVNPDIWLLLMFVFLTSLRKALANIDVHAIATTHETTQREMYNAIQTNLPSRAQWMEKVSLVSSQTATTQSREAFNKAPYKYTSNKLLSGVADYKILLGLIILLYLPKAISLAVCYYLVVHVFILLFHARNTINGLAKELPIEKQQLLPYIALPIVIILILFTIQNGFTPYVHLSWLLFAPGIAVAFLTKYFFAVSQPDILWMVVAGASVLTVVFIIRRERYRKLKDFRVFKKYLTFSFILLILGMGINYLNKGTTAMDQTMASLYPGLYQSKGQNSYPEYVVTAQSLNFREKAGKNHPVVGGLNQGDTVLVLNKNEENWWQIKFKNKKGYVYSKYLRECAE
jgi:hypothetical protein